MTARILGLLLLLGASDVMAQTISRSGFVEGRALGFPQTAPNDATHVVGDVLLREEVFLRPARWLRLSAGLDLHANSHDQVEGTWRLDLEDRGVRRPRAAVRRLSGTVAAGGLTLDVGKQFIRWGRADIIHPTDRFAPRDFLNVVDSELLPVIGARALAQSHGEAFEAVWVPQLTPSRLPLLDQRWVAVQPEAASLPLADGGAEIPQRAQYGLRWRHTGSRVETAVSYFDGYDHQPALDIRPDPDAGRIDIVRRYPALRMYGGDLAILANWLTMKAEVAYIASRDATGDDYALYVVEVERQAGEWLLDLGYAGEVVRHQRTPFVFAPDRLLARSVIGRAAHTIDPRRTLVIEAAVRQNGDGFYAKIEWSRAIGRQWRTTATGVMLSGDPQDFIGQYRRNSHGSLTLRLSF